jgi:hypothetical protein
MFLLLTCAHSFLSDHLVHTPQRYQQITSVTPCCLANKASPCTDTTSNIATSRSPSLLRALLHLPSIP